jgi:hypothetical protein
MNSPVYVAAPHQWGWHASGEASIEPDFMGVVPEPGDFIAGAADGVTSTWLFRMPPFLSVDNSSSIRHLSQWASCSNDQAGDLSSCGALALG